ncbi:MAG: tetratricopeptide repeat protein [Chthoniobacterales bacterium]|nr:tetratricopeptide repeat protein [Chthoniobacterales bacterium]
MKILLRQLFGMKGRIAGIVILFVFSLVCLQAETSDEKRLEEPIRVVGFVPQTKEDVYYLFLDEAAMLIDQGEYEKALQKLGEAEKLHPPDFSFYNLRGVVYTKLQSWKNAEENFRKAIELAPSFFPARFNFGEMLFLQRKTEEALQYFEVLNYSFPRNELIEFKLVMLFCITGRMEDAKRTASRMLFPGDTPAWYCAQAAILFKEGRAQEANRYTKAAQLIFGEDEMKIFWEGLDVSGLTAL